MMETLVISLALKDHFLTMTEVYIWNWIYLLLGSSALQIE
jgi:hypothetical protein